MTDQELLQAIGQVVESKIEPLRQDICEVKDRIGRLEVKMDHLETRMDHLETRMDKLEARMDQLEARMDQLEARMDKLEARMDKLEVRMDQLEAEVHALQAAHADLEEKVNGIRIYMDTEQKRTLNLLLEGQQAVWDRATPPEKYDALEVRVGALEMAARQHSQDLQELSRKLA